MSPSTPTPARAVALLALASLCFAVMALLAKHASRTIGVGQLALVRFAVGAAVIWAHAALTRTPLRFVRRDFLLVRAVCGAAAVLLYFLAVSRLTVGTATLLNYSSPIFVVWFSAIFLGEGVLGRHVVALSVAGCGVVLVILGQGKALGGGYAWMIAGVASAVLSGAAVTAIRAARKTDGAREIFGSFCLVGIFCSAPFALADWRNPEVEGWVLLAGVGAFSVVAQLLMTYSVAAVHAATAGILSQVTVVFALVLGGIFDREPMTWMSGLGATLTVGGAILANIVTAPKR
jgi:drug/metabolite transporter (DMT)-like permease